MLRHTSFSKRTHLPHSEHQPWGIGHTGNPLGIGHTGNRSDQEHGSVRTRHHSDVSCSSGRDSNTRRNTIPLHHAEPGEHSLASMISRPARNRSRSYDSVSPRCRSHLTSRSRGKKKSHKKRKHLDHLSLYADSNDEFNSHSEDAQDLVPDNTDSVLESQSESLRRTWDLLTLSKKFLNFFWPTCFLEN